jgi:membrane protein DedA with SNARE-associated domain
MSEKRRFLLRNMASGLIWLLVLVVVFTIFMNTVGELDYQKYIAPIHDNHFWYYFVFSVSEVFFGIIPPEIFMLVSAQKEDITFYVITVSLMTGISYGAGVLGYLIGNFFNDRKFYKKLQQNYLLKYSLYVKKFGGFIIIVASLTPLPFSAIAMIMGAVKYPFPKYLLFSLFRILRFIAYSILVYQTIFIS